MPSLLPPLPRIQAFEFNDFAPEPIRDSIIEALGRTLDWGRMLDALVPHYARFLQLARVEEVLDLGAGAGTPSLILLDRLRRAQIAPPTFVLTDLHPRPQLWQRLQSQHPDHIRFEPAPVDATRIDPKLSQGRARQIINVLHHFPEPLVEGLFRDAIAARRPLFIAEAFGRNPLEFLNFAPAGLPALMLNPLLSPRHRLTKALLTWASPVMLAASIWDGVISTLRIHTPEELLAIAARCPGNERYSWHTGTYPYPPAGTGFFLYGIPR